MMKSNSLWPYELNEDSPQAHKLIGWWPTSQPMVPGGTLRDFSVNDQNLSGAGNSAFYPTKQGMALDLDSGATIAQYNIASANHVIPGGASSDQFYVLATIYLKSLTAEDAICGETSQWAFRIESGFMFGRLAGDSVSEASASVVAGKIQDVGFHWDAGTRADFHYQGARVTGGASTNTSSKNTFYIGEVPGFTPTAACVLLDLRIYDDISIEEADALARARFNPATRYDLYREIKRKSYFVPAAAATDSMPSPLALPLMGVG